VSALNGIDIFSLLPTKLPLVNQWHFKQFPQRDILRQQVILRLASMLQIRELATMDGSLDDRQLRTWTWTEISLIWRLRCTEELGFVGPALTTSPFHNPTGGVRY